VTTSKVQETSASYKHVNDESFDFVTLLLNNLIFFFWSIIVAGEGMKRNSRRPLTGVVFRFDDLYGLKKMQVRKINCKISTINFNIVQVVVKRFCCWLQFISEQHVRKNLSWKTSKSIFRKGIRHTFLD